MSKEEKTFYKTVDLFGNEQLKFSTTPKKNTKNLFGDEYEDFVNKFETKLTTDDCYTPPAVYQVVLDYVNKRHPLKDCEIIRPFFPGGKFDEIEYPNNAVVVDNPPFSIISKISRFYEEKNIPYFLFAPHLTLFNVISAKNYIVSGVNVVYENGAVVATSFISNMFGDDRIIADADFYLAIKKLMLKKNELPKYKYPKNVVTVSEVTKIVSRGVSITIKAKDLISVSKMDDQKKHKKKIFGSGFFISNEEARAMEARPMEAKDEIIEWELSPRELELISKLGK
jgi:hypothetical protein